MTDENTKAERSVMDCVPTDFYDHAYDHYAKALRKHPRFADSLFDFRADQADIREGMKPMAMGLLETYRKDIAHCDRIGYLEAWEIERCEMAEAYVAHVNGDAAACVEELYDAVAVLMRMIAVVEGKQRLGGEK